MSDTTDKQIAEAAEAYTAEWPQPKSQAAVRARADYAAGYRDGLTAQPLPVEVAEALREVETFSQSRPGSAQIIRAALAARQVPEDVAALVARLERKYDFYKQVHGKGEHETMVLLREAAAALEVSSRTVAPNRDDIARVFFNHNAVNLGSAIRWGSASERMKRTAYEYADALLAADLWHPAPVIDRDALAKFTSEHFDLPAHYGVEFADALLASGWQPASPRTVTTVEALDALPVGSVIRMNEDRGGGYVYEKFSTGWGRAFGGRMPVGSTILSGYGPASVLYVPSEGVES